MHKHAGVLVLVLSVALPQLWAHDDAVTLDPFEVVAEDDPKALDLVTTGVDVMAATDTGREAAGSLGEVLAWEPGVSSSFYGAGASRPVVRGMDGFRVGVYDSGLSTGDLSASSPDHAVAIEPLFVRTITIHRGAAALLHGGGAIGGAVDTTPDFLPDKSTPEGWTGEAGAFYATVNEGRTTYLKGGYRDGAVAVRVNLLERESEDYAIPGFARTSDYDVNNRLRLPPRVRGLVAPNPDGRVPNTWTQTRVGALGLGWLGDDWMVQSAFQRFDAEYGVPLDGHTHGNPFGEPGVTGPSVGDGVTVDLTQDRVLGKARIGTGWSLLDDIELKGALTRFQQRELEGRFLSNDFRQDGADLHLAFASRPGPFEVFSGVSFARHDYSNRNISYAAGRADEDLLETGSDLWGAYALGEVEVWSTTIRLGARMEWQDAGREDAGFTNFTRTDSAGSVVLELVQALPGPWQVALSLGNTARIPNAEELYIEAPHGAIGAYIIPLVQEPPSADRPDPVAIERARSAEVRLQRIGERVRVSASVFMRDFDDYVYLEKQNFEVGGLTAYTRLQRDARFVGGELEAVYAFSTFAGIEAEVSVFGDYVRGTDRRSERPGNQPLPRMPPLRTGARLDLSWDRWSAGIDALHVFAQDRVPLEVFGLLSYQSPSDAYTLINLHLERDFTLYGADVQLGINISNLLDEEARQHTSFLKDVAPLPGRSIQISARIQL